MSTPNRTALLETTLPQRKTNMFEQTFLDTRSSARPWPMAVSLAAQTVFAGSILLIPLLHTAQLAWQPAVIVFAPPRPVPPPPTPVVEQDVVAQDDAPRAPTLLPVFRPTLAAPRRVPTTLSMLPPDFAPALPFSSAAASFSALPFIPESLSESNRAPVTASHTVPGPKPSMVRISNGVQAAKLIHQIKPAYPQLARMARVQGTVRLQAIIARSGAIQNLQLIGGPPLLIAAALDAVRQWTYQPTLLNGEPVEVVTEIDVNFTLNQ
ncbi:MAG: TonB family protein [Acidobacteriota bacterium]|nr:TonB family protein [Acidobacteriota bacterium]